MFTGIVESIGKVEKVEKEKDNIHFTISCPFVHELKIDQSVAHNGVCLTVTDIADNCYTVTAIKETLEKSNLKNLATNDTVNLERAMAANGRFDGHIVQGHVDQKATCISIEEDNGSWIFGFEYIPSENVTVEKGSITVNGVSLTVINSRRNQFSVAIIPYTKEHTTFNNLRINEVVNLEFDIIGKYVSRLLNKHY